MQSRILFCFCLLIFSVVCAFAQNTNRLSGTVSDQNGAIVAGAGVTLVEIVSGRTRRAQTSTNGSYLFENIASGKYRITISAPNFNDLTKEIQVSGSTVTANFQLSVGGVSAVVNVESEAARIELDRLPGATELLTRQDIQQTPANNLKDVLNFTPGVLAQSRYGSDEAQLSVRGSGLRNNYHARGINILINGLPYGDADGFSDYEALEFLAAQRIEVWKGANALRFGGNTAGGAIDLVTETGDTALPLELRIQGGAYGNYKGYISTGGKKGRFGYFVSGSASEFEGYREHSYQGRRKLFGNVTFDYSKNTGFYADVVLAKMPKNCPARSPSRNSEKIPGRQIRKTCSMIGADSLIMRAFHSAAGTDSAEVMRSPLVFQGNIVTSSTRSFRFLIRTLKPLAANCAIAICWQTTASWPDSLHR